MESKKIGPCQTRDTGLGLLHKVMAVEQIGTVLSQSTAVQLPVFDTTALSSLTQRIKSNREKHGRGSAVQSSPANSKVKKEKKKAAKTTSHLEVSTLKTAAKGRESKTPAATAKPKTTAAPKPIQGKKRLHDGRLKEPGKQKNTGSVNSIALGDRAPRSAKGGDFDIDGDMKAVGGTEDDIDLIADAHSGSEIEDLGGKLVGNDVQKDLQRLIRQLGVDHMAKDQQSEDTASEEGVEGHQQANGASVIGMTAMKQANTNGTQPGRSATKQSGKGASSLAFQPQSNWHAVELPTLPLPTQETIALPVELSNSIYGYAKSLLDEENKQYAGHSRSTSSAHQFYSTIMSTGTLSDKISALTLSVQESPVHNMKALESLVGLARKRSRGQAVEVLGALKDLFGPGNLLPSDRKLRQFVSQPALSAIFSPTDFHWTSKDTLPKPLKPVHLIQWAYEDWLKTTYFEVLKIIETWCNDEVVFARGKAVDYVCQLLRDKPEQESNLLRLLVNKLGDSDKKIASKTSFNILQLETTHPLMKPTIIAAIEADLIFRPGQSLHAKYYATITLNQTVLSGKEEGVARKLLDIYFSMFVKLLEKPDLAKPAVAGVNNITINRKGEVQGGGGAGGKKAQKKLEEKEKATSVDEDLREKMLSAVLTGVNRAMPFTNTNDESFEKHLDTLFKVTHSSNFNTSIQALMLIQQLNGSHQGSVDRFYRTLYESLLDPRLLTSSKQALYLNLLFRALRSDLNIKRIKAFAKRLLQVVAMHQPSFTCGTLYLLRELESVFANLEAFIDQPEEDDDEEENFKDVQEVTTNGTGNSQIPRSVPISQTERSQKYDGRKRDPEYSNADHSSLWELTPFLTHYHPSVSLFATRLLTHTPMPPKPDLSLNTLIHFLDRFVYRNPKTTHTPKGASIMQPMAHGGGGDSSALLVSAYSDKDRSRAPLNSEAFWKMESGMVNADEVFFHKYFSTLGRGRERAQRRKSKAEGKKEDAGGSESEGGSAAGDEDEIWKALVDSRPELDEGSDGGIFSDDDDHSEMDDSDDDDEGALLDLDDTTDHDDAPLASDEEDVPSDLDLDAAAFEAEVQTGKSKSKSKGKGKKPEEEGETRGAKRRRIKSLPTFAMAEEYAGMLDGDGDEDGDG